MNNKDQEENWEKAFNGYLTDKYGVNPECLPDDCEELVKVDLARITWRDACEFQQKEIDQLKKQIEIAREDLEYLRKDFKGQYSSAETFYYTFIGKTLEKLKELEK